MSPENLRRQTYPGPFIINLGAIRSAYSSPVLYAFRGAVLAVRGPDRRGHKKVLQWAPVSVNIKTVLNFVVLWIKRKGGGPPAKRTVRLVV